MMDDRRSTNLELDNGSMVPCNSIRRLTVCCKRVDVTYTYRQQYKPRPVTAKENLS
jgi:hypothetical protein